MGGKSESGTHGATGPKLVDLLEREAQGPGVAEAGLEESSVSTYGLLAFSGWFSRPDERARHPRWREAVAAMEGEVSVLATHNKYLIDRDASGKERHTLGAQLGAYSPPEPYLERVAIKSAISLQHDDQLLMSSEGQ